MVGFAFIAMSQKDIFTRLLFLLLGIRRSCWWWICSANVGWELELEGGDMKDDLRGSGAEQLKKVNTTTSHFMLGLGNVMLLASHEILIPDFLVELKQMASRWAIKMR